jgi:hypothetical protein
MVGEPWTAFAPLLNFTFQSQEPIPVFDDIRIRRLTTEDQGDSDSNSMFRFLTQRTPETPSGLSTSWALVGEFQQPWESTVIQTQGVEERFNRVLAALHLLHDEMVEFPFIMFGKGKPPIYSMGTRSNPFPSLQAWQRAVNRPYMLHPGEAGQLRELAQRLEDQLERDSEGALAIALGRVNATHFRLTDADRIIDSAIALEAILLRGADGEFSYRQAIRGAHLLGGSAYERQETFKFLRKAYDRRSTIVHGAKDPKTPPTDQILSLMRRIIRAFVDATIVMSHEDLIASLDASAVGGV